MRRFFFLFVFGCLCVMLNPTFAPTVAAQQPTKSPTPSVQAPSIKIVSVTQIENSNSIEVKVQGTSTASSVSLRFRVTGESDRSIEYPHAINLSSAERQTGFTRTYKLLLSDKNSGIFASGNYNINASLTTSGASTQSSFLFDFFAAPAATLQIDSVQYTPGTNTLTVAINGYYAGDVDRIQFAMGTWTEERTISQSGSYTLTIGNALPPGKYTLTATLEIGTTFPQINLVTAESEPFTYDPPYVGIQSVKFDASSNTYTVEYLASRISQANFYIALPSSNVWEFTKTPINVQSIDPQEGIVTLNANDIPLLYYVSVNDRSLLNPVNAFLPAYTPIIIRVDAVGQTSNNQTLSLTRQSTQQNYFPNWSFRWFWAIRYYWWATLGFVLFVVWVGFRQVNWWQRVQAAPFALVSPQRQRVIRRKVANWQTITALDPFIAQIGRPGAKVSTQAQAAKTLQTEPDNFRTLRQYTAFFDNVNNAREQRKRLSPARRYRNEVLRHVSKVIENERKTLLDAYQTYEQWATNFRFSTNPPTKFDSALDSLLWQLDQLQSEATRAQSGLQPYIGYFTEASELESIQYLGELAIDMRGMRATATDDIANTDVVLERVLSRLNLYIAALPPIEKIFGGIDPENGVVTFREPKTPLRELLQKFADAVERSRQTIVAYRLEVVQQLEKAIAAISEINAIPILENTLKAVKGDRFGDQQDALQISLDMLDEIAQDVASAVSQVGYYRRLYLQDAHIKTRDLYARVKNDLTTLAPELLKMSQLFEEQRQNESGQDDKVYRNPYVTSTPVKSDKVALFKGRVGITANVINRLRDRRSGTILLYGARRMGKSSFLYHLENLLPASHIPVFIDCQGGTTQDEGSFFYQIARNIYSVLRKRDPGIARRITKPNDEDYITIKVPYDNENVSLDENGAIIVHETDEDAAENSIRQKKKNPSARLEEWLSEEVSGELRGRILLITLDEFEEIGNAIREKRMSVNVLKQIRHMIQHSEYLLFLFAGVATLDVLVHNAASYFISVNTIELSYLEDVATEALIRRPFQPEDPTIKLDESQIGRVPDYEDNAVSKIMHLTRNQPYLVQAMCETLVNIANEEQLEVITLDHVERVASELGVNYGNYFSFYWQNWGVIGEHVLRSILNNEPLPNDNPGVVQATLDDMVRHRLIERRADGSYTVEVPLMEIYLRTKI
jgi:hypothetical protein